MRIGSNPRKTTTATSLQTALDRYQEEVARQVEQDQPCVDLNQCQQAERPLFAGTCKQNKVFEVDVTSGWLQP